MSFFKWSKTAASNGTADPSCPFPEGMAPSAVNDGTRGMMAAAAKYRDDTAGAIVTGGTLNAYTVASYQGFGSLATDLNNQMIAFSPHVTNGDTVTLNVDSLGAKPLRSAPSVELVAGTLVQGTPYVALYNNTDAAFYLRGFISSPYNIPFLGGLDFWDTTTPNSSFIFPFGQAISRSVYSRAFARWGTTFGAGDGSTTFNVPDKRGRVSAASDNLGGTGAGRLTGASGMGVGGFTQVGGAETKTLVTANLPPYTPAGTITEPMSTLGLNVSGGGVPVLQPSGSTAGTFTGTAQGGTSNPFATVQPTIVVNYILRIL